MATYINNNVKFHAFSKSPVSPDTTLGGAVNPSGHTITTSQVRSQDIPAFLNTFQGTKDQAITWLGTNYATPAHNDIAYYGGEFKAGFDTPKCLKYNGETSTWEDFDLKYTDRANNVLRTTLKNADDKDVLAIHQDCTTVFVDGGNNAATNSNRWSLFVKKSDGSILDHFVASTDKIVAGMPSLGYNALVMLNNAAIDEGELEANYVGNTFAGIIHLNKQYANGDDAKFKVTCFEYIGEKLDTTVADLAAAVFGEGSPDNNDTSLTQKVAQNTAAIAKLNGSATETGSVAKAVADAEARVKVTTDALQTAIDAIDTGVQSVTKAGSSDLLTIGGTAADVTISLSDAVATKTYAENKASEAAAAAEQAAKTEAATNLATARGEITQEINAAKQSAIDNAKVTLTQGTGITVTPNATASTAFTVAIDGTVALKSEVEKVAGDLTTAQTTLQGNIDGVAARVTTAEGDITSLKTAVNTTLPKAIEDAKTAAEKTATDAVADLETKLTTAEGSLGKKVEALETAVDTAQAAAEAAQDTADQAVADAAAAQGAADKAQGAAEAAQGTADQALADAAAAQKQADKGVADAATAQAQADKGVADAAAAQTAAEAAQGAADALETRMDAAESSITATTTIITDLKKVSLTKDSGDGLVKVSTVGTIGDGLQSISVEVSDTIVKTTDEFNVTSTGSNNVEVKLTGTVANPSITVKGTDIASAADLTALTTKVDSHIASAAKLSIIVASADSEGRPVVETPETNKLYLVAGQGAESGTYVEWIYLEGGTWERIGTTATDLSEYAKTATVTPLIEAAQTQADKGVADAATAKAAADKAQKAADDAQADVDALEKLVGTTSVGSQIDTKLSALTDTVAQGGAGVTLTQTNGKVVLTVSSGVVEASGDTADKFVKGTTVHAAINSAIQELDKTTSANGISLTQTDGIAEISVTPGSVAENNASVVTGGAVYAAIDAAKMSLQQIIGGVTSNMSNVANALQSTTTRVTTLETTTVPGVKTIAEQGIADAAAAQATADAKIASVTAKTETYYGAPLVSATTDASKHVTITAAANKEWSVSDVTLTGDTIVEVINGKMMGTGPTIVIDDANLVNGESMFVGQTLMGTFVGNLGKLTNGKSMFSGCTSLVDFCADLGSLVDGTDMFKGCTLTEESLIYIVDSLPTVSSGTICLGTAVDGVLEAEAVAKGWTVVVA